MTLNARERETDSLLGSDAKIAINDEVSITKRPAAWMVHLALITTQLSFGGGSVVGKLGVSGTNPVLFALIREGTAGPLLMAIAGFHKFETPKREDMVRLLAAGVCIFLNQFCFIVGLKLSDPTTGSIWQPSQPIFTTALALLLQYEKPDVKKILGILFAVGGAAFMIAYPSSNDSGSSSSSSGSSGSTSNPVVANILFFINCVATSGYVILTKPLLSSKKYESISITGWSYISASFLMLITALVINTNDSMLDFVCPKHDCKGAWSVPNAMIFALLYWIFFNSVLAYGLMTWANGYAKASIVSAYTVLQPVTSAVLSMIIIAIKGHHWAVTEKGFEEPGVKDVGAIGIVIGLALVMMSKTLDEDDNDDDQKSDSTES